VDFNEARDDGVAVASARPLCKSFAPRSRQITHQHLITQGGWSSSLPDNQQCQSTECNCEESLEIL